MLNGDNSSVWDRHHACRSRRLFFYFAFSSSLFFLVFPDPSSLLVPGKEDDGTAHGVGWGGVGSSIGSTPLLVVFAVFSFSRFPGPVSFSVSSPLVVPPTRRSTRLGKRSRSRWGRVVGVDSAVWDRHRDSLGGALIGFDIFISSFSHRPPSVFRCNENETRNHKSIR